jgi:spore germination protein (amino acid permease)
MKNDINRLAPMLFFPLLIIPPLSYGLFKLPFYAAQQMGADGYLGIIAAALLTVPGLSAIYWLAKWHPGQSLTKQGLVILGPIFGRVTGIIYAATTLLLLTTLARDLLNMIAAYFNPRTPHIIIVTLLLIAEAYLASRGIETIARIASFLLLPGLAILFLLGTFGLSNVSFSHLLPIESPSILHYLEGGLSLFYIFFLLGVSGIILPYLRPLKSFPRLAGLALVILIIMFSIFTLGSIGVYGYGHIQHFAWPALEYVHTIDFPYFLLEQAGLLLILDWLAMILIGAAFLCSTIAIGTTEILGTKKYEIIVWVIAGLKLFLLLYPQTIAEIKWVFHQIANYGWYIFFVYPILLWFIELIFIRRGRIHAT